MVRMAHSLGCGFLFLLIFIIHFARKLFELLGIHVKGIR